MYHIFSICSSANEHVGCIHILTVVNSAAMNIGVHLSFQILVFSRCVLSGGIVGSYGDSWESKQVKLKMSMGHPTGADKMAGINILDSGQNSLLLLF